MPASKGLFLVPCGKQTVGGKNRSRVVGGYSRDGTGLALAVVDLNVAVVWGWGWGMGGEWADRT